jgi:CMP-N-acetylneuraminic acid synthetase
MNVDKLRTRLISQFERIKPYEMSDEYSVDIDNEQDWQVAEQFLKSKRFSA